MSKQGEREVDERLPGEEGSGMVDLGFDAPAAEAEVSDIGTEEGAEGESEKQLRDAFNVEDGQGEQAGNKGEQPPESDAVKPDGTKNEKPPEGKKPEEGEEIDKIEKPTPEDWKRFREEYKAHKRQLREIEGKKADKPNAEAARAPDRPATDVDAGEVFKVYAEVVAGDNEKVSRAKVEKFITENLTPEQVADTILKAKNGEFGEASAEIMALAQEQLPMVTAMSGRLSQERRKVAEAERVREESLNDLLKEYPEARDEKSQHYREINAAVGELQTLVHPSIMQLPNAPRIVKEYMALQKKAAAGDGLKKEVDRLTAEIAQLRGQLGRPAAPGGGGSGGKRAGEQQSADEWLEQEIAKAKS